MNITVLVKSIPDPNGDVVLGDDFLVNRDGEGTLDPGDEYAVEAALQLAEADRRSGHRRVDGPRRERSPRSGARSRWVRTAPS